jgi:hypothetical protein
MTGRPDAPAMEGRVYRSVLKALTAYLAVSALTLPVMDALWVGEIPLLALPQVPKVTLAKWVRTEVVVAYMRAHGLSKGSPSPDSIAARPYALAITYLVPLGALLGLVALRTGLAPHRRWVVALVAVAALDFYLTLTLAGGSGFTIY